MGSCAILGVGGTGGRGLWDGGCWGALDERGLVGAGEYWDGRGVGGPGERWGAKRSWGVRGLCPTAKGPGPAAGEGEAASSAAG